LAVLSTVDDARPLPPEGFTEAERDLWADVVTRLPAGWFPPETWEHLAAYCHHAISARDLSRLVSAFEPKWLSAEGGLERLDRLLRMRDRECRAMMACARALRLTNQSRYDARAAGRRADGAHGGSVYDMLQDHDDD